MNRFWADVGDAGGCREELDNCELGDTIGGVDVHLLIVGGNT